MASTTFYIVPAEMGLDGELLQRIGDMDTSKSEHQKSPFVVVAENAFFELKTLGNGMNLYSRISYGKDRVFEKVSLWALHHSREVPNDNSLLVGYKPSFTQDDFLGEYRFLKEREENDDSEDIGFLLELLSDEGSKVSHNVAKIPRSITQILKP